MEGTTLVLMGTRKCHRPSTAAQQVGLAVTPEKNYFAPVRLSRPDKALVGVCGSLATEGNLASGLKRARSWRKSTAPPERAAKTVSATKHALSGVMATPRSAAPIAIIKSIKAALSNLSHASGAAALRVILSKMYCKLLFMLIFQIVPLVLSMLAAAIGILH